jgi:hypothetical protein
VLDMPELVAEVWELDGEDNQIERIERYRENLIEFVALEALLD